MNSFSKCWAQPAGSLGPTSEPAQATSLLLLTCLCCSDGSMKTLGPLHLKVAPGGLPWRSVDGNSPAGAGGTGSIPSPGRFHISQSN